MIYNYRVQWTRKLILANINSFVLDLFVFVLFILALNLLFIGGGGKRVKGLFNCVELTMNSINIINVNQLEGLGLSFFISFQSVTSYSKFSCFIFAFSFIFFFTGNIGGH